MGERVIPSLFDMVKFAEPFLVKEKEKETDSILAKALKEVESLCSPRDQKSVCETNLQEILNCIIEPLEWEENGLLWRQELSKAPATRRDVARLTEELDARLQQREARETGLCPVRNELMLNVFNEVIRQVAINCAERGMLLIRIRNELFLTTKTFRTLYESSIAYGMRKTLVSMDDAFEKQHKIAYLKEKIEKLEGFMADEELKYTMLEKRAQELTDAEQEKMNEELEMLKKINQQITAQLEAMIAPDVS